ncbi:cation-translocating P-type ATPase [Diaphorobacter nitroreducens]|uniref:cation-translocating P-type ATPase n=1 Tax=Diaphorobacter nitroreducens TaxID=164759 RepID=UPI0028AAE303|nr:cation-translocating P-type ATPase [Diaphorobacter nitroreducens]
MAEQSSSHRHGLQGLSSAEAAERLARDGPNQLPGNAPKSTFAIVREVLTEPMFLMLLAAGGVYLALGDKGEALFLLSFVFVVIGITLVQERRTQRALESLRDLSAPRALVLRDGVQLRIAGRDVVCGDLLVLREGDRVAGDAQLLSGQLEVDESLLTGESVPAAKHPCASESASTLQADTDSDRVFASTVVTRGTGLARVHATAGHTAVGRIGADLATTQTPSSPLQQRSRRLVRSLGLLALVLAGAQVLLGWGWAGRPLLDSLLSGIALAMALLPEEIPVILTVFLALGAWRIAQRQVLTRRITAVETLGAVTVLAVDKTGTLTMNRMAVAELATPTLQWRADGAQALPEALHPLVEWAMLATPGDPFDPMEKAIQHFGHTWLQGTEHVHDGREPEFAYDLSGEILAMTRVYATGAPQRHLLATKGAPEAVADLCHLDADRRAALRRQVEDLAERGLRVLGVARGQWTGEGASPGQPPAWPGSQHDFDFEFLGLVALADPPRPEVPEAIAQCRSAGVRVVMMTGDHPATARAIARQVGLSERPQVLTGDELQALDDATLRERLRHTDLCARLKPAHKLRLVQALRADGAVVAMTGDGVNDAPALKAADVGIAMGERGTDVAREAAALVLLQDSFAHIVAAIRQGRRIDDNVRKATRFVFAVHVPIVALALVPTLLHWPALLLPVHIVLLELLIDPACSVVFEAEPEQADTMQRPARPVQDSPFALRALLWPLAQGLGVAALLLGAQAWLHAQGWEAAQGRAVVLGTLLVCVLLLIQAQRDPTRPLLVLQARANRWLAPMAAAVGLLLAAILGIPVLRDLMGLAPAGLAAWGAGAGVLVLSVVWLEGLRRIARRKENAR